MNLKSGYSRISVERGPKGVAHDLDGLGLWPQPCHVDVAVADGLHAELLHVRAQHIEFALRRTERSIEGCLIAFVQRAEADGLHSCIKLLLAFSLAVGIGGDKEFRCHDFLAKNGRIRASIARVEHKRSSLELGLRRPAAAADGAGWQHAHGDQQLLTGLRDFASV